MRSHARTTARNRNWRPLRFVLWSCMIVTPFPVVSEAQYKGDRIPGFLGLDSGTQAPAGLYVGNVVWVYPTSTIKDNSGHDVTLPGSLTSTAELILLSVVTNYKLFGAHLGGSAAFPFIKNRIQLNLLDVNTGFAYTDMFIGASLGWHLKRADITAGYNLYIPTGRFSQGGTDNTGLGIWGNELTGILAPSRLAQNRSALCCNGRSSGFDGSEHSRRLGKNRPAATGAERSAAYAFILLCGLRTDFP